MGDNAMTKRGHTLVARSWAGPAGIALLALAQVVTPSAARAETPDSSAGANDLARLSADVNRLKQEMRDQRQLILQLMQMDQQRYDVLLRYLQAGPPSPGAGLPGLPRLPPIAGPAGVESPSGAAPPGGAAPAVGAKETGAAPREVGTVSGRVRTNGPLPAELYVYLDGPRGAPVHNHTVEIKQKDKQFSPRVTVVPLGTRLIFPNVDTVIHNVFSDSPGNAFDLGSVKTGERSAPVVLLKPGHIEIFCNIHSKMRADVLVVPNGHWTRVAADGSFQIAGVPTGVRRVAVWGPSVKPAVQEVEVTAKGATVAFAPESTAAQPHMNKRGQAYGSYDD
jgi:plastocyanin